MAKSKSLDVKQTTLAAPVGKIEDDRFAINDVELSISPQQIHVEKRAYNYQWSTLRTASSRKAKSGNGVVEVSIEVVFTAEDVGDKLIPLVAGLRATPFCVVENSYLNRTLGKLDQTNNNVSGDEQWKHFKPIMLAMTNMSFSTAGHIGMPTVITANFYFIWFNYLPFTSIVAFKTGDFFDRPGSPAQSLVWKKFYEPFLIDTKDIKWPHEREDSSRTSFSWREFLMVPEGSPEEYEKVGMLADVIKQMPREVAQVAQSVAGSAEINPSEINSQGVIGAIYNKIKQDHRFKNTQLSLDEALTEWSGGKTNLKNIQKIGDNTLGVAVSKLLKGDTSGAKSEADKAVAVLAKRAEQLRQLERTGKLAKDNAEGNGYTKLTTIEAKFADKQKMERAGGMVLYGRKRNLDVYNNPISPFSPSPIIIEQITISFVNTIATIPMVGYTYPVCQHTGSMDAHVSFVMNTTNDGAGTLHQLYDSIEGMALRFKQIPQGLTNLYINNDFLKIFGIQEFITSNISSDTLPQQPGRSRVVLTLTDAGITSKTRFDDPEDLKQEYIQGDTGLYRKTWKILSKHLREEGADGGLSFSGSRFTGANHLAETALANKGVRNTTGTRRYYLKRVNVKNDTRNLSMASLVDEARDNYNQLLKSLHEKVFQHGFSISDEAFAGRKYYDAFMDLQEMDPEWGYIPGLDSLQASLKKRNEALIKSGRHKEVTETIFTSKKRLKEEGLALEQARKAGAEGLLPSQLSAFDHISDIQLRLAGWNDDLIKTVRKLSKGTIENKIENKVEEVAKKSIRLNEIGLNKYLLAQHKLFQKIINQYLGVDQFEGLAKAKESMGLQKGIPAYPDFKPQLISVAGIVNKSTNEAILNNYDPDCYFWYPVHHGAGSALSGIIDDFYIAEARRYSEDIYRQAQGEGNDFAKSVINTFFGGTYLQHLGSTDWKVPVDAVIKNTKGKVPEPYYSDLFIGPATRTGTQGILKSTHPDIYGKLPTNFSGIGGPAKILCPNECQQSTNFFTMWTGCEAGANSPATGSGGNTRKDGDEADQAKLPATTGGSSNKSTPKFGWPVAVPTKIPKGYRFGRPRTYRGKSKTHKGIDLGGFHCGGYNGEPVYAAADGIVDRVIISNDVGGNALRINHGGGWYTMYMHLEKFDVGKGRVKKGQQIGLLGHTGIKHKGKDFANAHLHFAVLKGQTRLDPEQFLPMEDMKNMNLKRRSPSPRQQREIERRSVAGATLARDVTTTISSPLRLAINEFEKDMLRGQGQSMMRAYPTFKLYFIEDDSGERKRFAFDDFFSYNAVKSIRVVRNRNIAADLCELYLVNISGTLSNRKFHSTDKPTQPVDHQGKTSRESSRVMDANTSKENPIASLLLQEGIHIHLKMGFANDPDRLETVFNGIITEVQFAEGEELVRILAQSYAVELVQDIKGVEIPIKRESSTLFGWDFWGFKTDATTGRILEEMLAEPEVLHFGRWEPTPGAGMSNGTNPVRNLLTKRWTFLPSPQDDNIFVPDPAAETEKIGEGFVWKELKYIIYRTTIWDIFREMELRHPNCVALPVPYEDQGKSHRMTMFFGLPNQLYFARSPDTVEQQADQALRDQQKSIIDKYGKKLKIQEARDLLQKIRAPGKAMSTALNFMSFGRTSKASQAIRRMFDPHSAKVVQEAIEAAESLLTSPLKEERLQKGKIAGYIKPFRNYHLLTSAQHIVSNNIQANSRDVANNIVIKYQGVKIEGKFGGGAKATSEEKTFSLKLDSALPTEDIRTQIGEFVNVTHEELAKRYALGLLIRNARNIYKGELITIGNPKIKPVDICFLLDEQTDMTGAIEVEQVVHTLDQEHGFLTEIKPNMLVQAAEWSLLSSCEALGIVMEGALRCLFGKSTSPAHTGSALQTFSPWPWMMGAGVHMFGGFMSQKILNYTQFGFPLVMSPLLHHGRIFSGGVPTRKIPTSIWSTAFAKWRPSIDAGYSSWLEDKKDEIINSIKAGGGLFQQGDFWNNGGDSPI